MDSNRFATVYEAFRATARSHAASAFLAAPAKAGRDYHPDGYEIGYGTAHTHVDDLIAAYRAAGYGIGHRVALMLDNRPEHMLHFLALNALGITQVPVNPDYLHHELFYLLDHSEADLAVVLPKHGARMEKVAAERSKPLPIVVTEGLPGGALPPARTPALTGTPGRATEAALMYTSGTTGRPKGCILDNEFCFSYGGSYAGMGGCLALQEGDDRTINPLPLFHVNAGIVSFVGMIVAGGCQIIPDRFHPSTWWDDVISTRATVMHYLGIMPPILMKQAPSPRDRQHRVRFGLGAGIDPAIHRAFEQRFNIPMVEVWGMSETGRLFGDAHEPRRIDTRAFGKPWGTFEARIVDEQNRDLPRGHPGELLVRDGGPDPRRGFFRGYLKDADATEKAWTGGWFHTGDVATQGDDGMLYFVERRKNIIRRSGENISAAEVENGILEHASIAKVTALAIEDELREEEVMACVVLRPGEAASRATAEAIAAYGRERLAYFKVPGWIVFVDDLPTTSTQKVQKGLIFAKDQDPRRHPGAFDLRALKKRETA
jgi:acyl-CoA synthetase (AMP-forming)/AMP-acid ligase II